MPRANRSRGQHRIAGSYPPARALPRPALRASTRGNRATEEALKVLQRLAGHGGGTFVVHSSSPMSPRAAVGREDRLYPVCFPFAVR
jgi:hypothetical protein